MTYNRSEIMTRAWEIVRRFEGNGETTRECLSRVLKYVWWQVKSEAAAKAASVAHMAAMAAIPQDRLEHEIHALENCDSRGYAERLDDLRIEARRRMAA